jgi:hypothetical protein
MSNVPWNNLNVGALQVVIMDPTTGEMAVPNVVASSVTIVASALPTGAATETTLAAVNTAIGAKTDAAWDGVAASASVISLLKAIALNTAA